MKRKSIGKSMFWLPGILCLTAICLLLLGLSKPTTAFANDISLEEDGSKIIISGTDSPGGTIEDFTDVHYISNKDYFIINPKHHKNRGDDNSSGSCTTVAAQMLLNYHNYYSDRRLIPKEQDGKIFLSDDYGNVAAHPEFPRGMTYGQGCSRIGTLDEVYQEIFDLNPVASNPTFGQSMPLVVNSVKKFIDKYTPEELRENISFQWDFYSKERSMFYLNSGSPIVLGFSPIDLTPITDILPQSTGSDKFHVVMAYGYATHNGEFGYLVHYCWGDSITQVWVPERWVGFHMRMDVIHEHTMEDTGRICNDTHRVFRCRTCGYEEPRVLYSVDDWACENTTITGTEYPLSGSIRIPTAIYSNSKGNVTVTKIGDGAFANQTQLTNISVSNRITEIDANAFANCMALETVSIPMSVTSIGAGAFRGCDNARISVLSSNASYASQDGVLYNKSKTTIVAAGKIASDYTVPATVTEIAPYAFAANGNLTTLRIHTGLSVGAYAFADCENLSVVYYLTSDMPQIGEYAFLHDEFNLFVPQAALDALTQTFIGWTSRIYPLRVFIQFRCGDTIARSDYFYYGATWESLPTYEQTGYTFGGWYADEMCVGEEIQEGAVITFTEDVVLYAKQTPNTYSVTLYAGEGELQGESAFEVTYGKSFAVNVTATREGHVLDGWTDDEGKLYLTAAGESMLPWDKAEDSALYAVWRRESYTIRIVGEKAVWLTPEGGFSEEECAVHYGDVVFTVNLVPIFRDSQYGYMTGHIFDHFLCNDAKWETNGAVDLGEDGENIDIIPVWKKEKHTIYFNTFTETVFSEIIADFGEDISLPATAMRTGYVFGGWYTVEIVNGKITYLSKFTHTKMPDLTNGEQANGSVQLYAYWAPITYFITYQPNGGTGIMNNTTHTYGVSQNLRSNAFTRTYYNFAGWALSASGEAVYGNAESVANLATRQGEVVTLYAVWTPYRYAISFMNCTFEGQTAHIGLDYQWTSQPLDYYEYGVGRDVNRITAFLSSATPYVPKMVFMGWYTDMTFRTPAPNITSQQTGEVHLFAKWRYDFGYLRRDTTYTITDAGEFSQGLSYDRYSLGFKYYDLYDKLKDMGIQYLSLNFKLRMWEIDDGYQEFFLYAGEGNDKLLWSITNYEHGGAVKDSTKRLFEQRILISIEQLKDVDALYFRYGAHGKKADDWASDCAYLEVSYVVEGQDVDAPAFTWERQNPFA